jgi:hypothetical protein
MTTTIAQNTGSKRITIIYWIFTGLLGVGMLFSAIPGLLGSEHAVTFFAQLGYPKSLIIILGVAKILGVIAIVIPGYPRIKEWAYAGLTFDLAGATCAQIAIGAPIVNVSFMLPWFIFLFGSYVYYHKKYKPTL